MFIRPLNRYERRDPRLMARAISVILPPTAATVALTLAVCILGAIEELSHFIVAGRRMLTSAGNRILRNGKRRIANGTIDSCCCCEECTHCSDSVPSAYNVTFTDTALCASLDVCQECALAFSYIYTGTEINGTYTVVCNNVCNWAASVASSVTSTFYDTSDCTGTPFDSTNTLTIVLTKTASTTMRLSATIGNSHSIFADTMTSDTTCADAGGYSFTNELSCADCVLFNANIASGGTAVATPV